jgi:hypothetical protein
MAFAIGHFKQQYQCTNLISLLQIKNNLSSTCHILFTVEIEGHAPSWMMMMMIMCVCMYNQKAPWIGVYRKPTASNHYLNTRSHHHPSRLHTENKTNLQPGKFPRWTGNAPKKLHKEWL